MTINTIFIADTVTMRFGTQLLDLAMLCSFIQIIHLNAMEVFFLDESNLPQWLIFICLVREDR